jgi:hypothetical protein
MSNETNAVETTVAPMTEAKKKVTKKAVKKAPAKTAKKKVAKKAAKTPKKESKPREKALLTGNEIKVLTALKDGKQLNRVELNKKTGISKGWSKMLGAATRDGLGASGEHSLAGRKLIRCMKLEDERTLRYEITAAGKALLAKVATK